MPKRSKEQKQELERFYGDGMPFLEDDGSKWESWLKQQWRSQRRTARDKRLHYKRHRLFKAGHQWISNRDGRNWREPPADENTVRAVLNLIGPALDYRLGVLREQRPGFRFEPLGSTVNAKESADAQQVVVEYYFHILKMWKLFEMAFAAAQTDGCAFVHVFIDEDAGPRHKIETIIPPDDERFTTLRALGFEPDELGVIHVPVDEDGEDIEDPNVEVSDEAEGDLRSRVVYASEVLVDPEAKTINGPFDAAKWFMVRRIRDVKTARLETGNPNLEPDTMLRREEDATTDSFGDLGVNTQWERGLPPFPATRKEWKEGAVYDYLFYMAPSPIYEDGAWLRVIGNEVVARSDELPGRVIPFARVTDGSSDDDLFPRPVMSDWIGDQVAINALLSLLLSNARVWGGGRLLVQKDTVIEETFSAIVGSLVEYSGLAPTPLQPPRTSAEAWQLLQFLIKVLEDKHGWNDLARGQVSGTGSFQDVSGRAILGARELFERTLGPMVRAAADGVTEWAELIVRHGMWLFDGNPRTIPTMGGRPDLTKRITREKLGERPVVYADPETLIPLPRALRNQMLLDMHQQGMISLDEYKKRAPYADVKDAYSDDQMQHQRAQTINEVYFENYEKFDQMLEQAMIMLQQPNPELQQQGQQLLLDLYLDPSNGITVLWTDDPEVHKRVLLQVIADERKPWDLRRLLMDRYNIYEDLVKVKLEQLQPPLPDPQTGQLPPPAEVPLEVIGAPAELPRKGLNPPPPMPTPPQMSAGGGGVPGTGNIQTSPDPFGGAQGIPAISQDSAEPLGTFGGVEADAMER